MRVCVFIYSTARSNRCEMCGALTPQLYGIVAAAGCQKRRRRVKRNSGNPAAVLRQSGHKSRRRVVGGQQVTEVTGPLCPFRVATQVADELRNKWRRERALVHSLSALRTAHLPLKQSRICASVAHKGISSRLFRSIMIYQSRTVICTNTYMLVLNEPHTSEFSVGCPFSLMGSDQVWIDAKPKMIIHHHFRYCTLKLHSKLRVRTK